MPKTSKKFSKKLIILLSALIILFLIAGTYIYQKNLRLQKETVPASVSISQLIKEQIPATTTSVEKSSSPEVATLPNELNLDVPFYPQAPFGNWDYPWQEACEEASVLLIANVYYQHNWTRQEFNDQILQLVDWENKRFGDYKHTNVDQTAEILKDYLKLKTVIHENPTYDDVRKILAQGHLIVMTFAGKELGNPNYRNGGPVYHAMVIKGYKSDQKIITNDVGTHNGADYVYSWSTIDNALHDYAEPIDSGAKRIIEVIPPALPLK